MEKKLKELFAQRKAAREAAQAIIDKAKADNDRGLTDEEATQIDGFIATAERCKAEYEAIERRMAVQATLASDESWGKGSMSAPVRLDPQAGLSAPRITAGPDSSQFANFAEQLRAIVNASSPGGQVDRRLGGIQASVTGSGTTIPSDGGFLIQPNLAAGIMQRTYETSAILSRCQRIPVSGDRNGLTINAVNETSRAAGSRWGGVVAYRVAEGYEFTASRPALRQIKLELKKLIGMWYATDELLADAAAMQTVASTAFAEELAFATENEIINGIGGAQMLGIMAANATVSVAKETGQVADTIVKENVDKMWSRCYARSRGNAVWLINQECEPQLNAMSVINGVGGIPAYMPAGGISAAPYGTLYGRPVIPVEYCQQVGDKGDIILADLSQYLVIEKGGTETASTIHLRFNYGEQVFRWIVRNDGAPLWASALTPANATSGNTLSPFVTLNARA